MKVTKRQLKVIIENYINEDKNTGKAVTYGMLTAPVSFLVALSDAAEATGTVTMDLGAELASMGIESAELSGVEALNIEATLSALGEIGAEAAGVELTSGGMVATGLGTIGASMALVGLAGAAGYKVGDYINDYFTGNTGDKDEKFVNSFKRHAKDMIGELGIKVFGFEISNTWDTLSDEDYFKKAYEKGFKGLKPREIDDKRLNELLGMIIVHRNFSKDGKLPKNIDQLFAYHYLDADAFKTVIEQKEKSLSNSIMEKMKNKGQ